MQLIALKNFRNHGRIKVASPSHPAQVDRGAVFEIGTAATLKEMERSDDRNAELVARLTLAGCIGDANDPEVVKRVQDEIAVAARREAHAAELHQAASLKAGAAQLLDALAQLSTGRNPAAARPR